MSVPENPPAFPNRLGYGTDAAGMTLRDWFAGQALVGLIAEYANPASSGSDMREPCVHAAQAYALADAMIRARSNMEGENG